ncbi:MULTISPECIES: response regulator transcription factor [Amycolatopsis]|uniref:Response regulator transcription factor n=1 Tax=Amycolatopsis albidoflavus TaxID=102226 RepID=A0ABW5HSJ5_9PSEU
MSGFDLCRSIRTRTDGAIIAFPEQDSVEDRILGLLAGGDDHHLVKPSDVDELMARTHAVLRRRGRPRLAGTPASGYPTWRSIFRVAKRTSSACR